MVVGGAGFGKSTLAARMAATRPTAWYTLDASDRTIGGLAAGIAASLRVRLPAIPDDLAQEVETSIEPTDDAAVMAQARPRPRPSPTPSSWRWQAISSWFSTICTSSRARRARSGSWRR